MFPGIASCFRNRNRLSSRDFPPNRSKCMRPRWKVPASLRIGHPPPARTVAVYESNFCSTRFRNGSTSGLDGLDPGTVADRAAANIDAGRPGTEAGKRVAIIDLCPYRDCSLTVQGI